MSDKLALLQPEIALFITASVVMVLGLARRPGARNACALLTALGLAVAAWLSLNSPRMEGALLPGLLAYAKTLVAVLALLLTPLMAGLVDRDYEAAVARGEKFDPLRSSRGEFYAFLLLSVMGVMLCASADDLIWLFLALELTSLPTYVMVAMSSRRTRAQEAGVKYFFLGAFGAAMFLYGFATLYGATGTTSLPEMAAVFSAGGVSPLATLGLVIAIAGISFKIAAVPMHFYTPDVYQGAATPVAAYLAFAPKAAGFFALMQLLSAVGWTHGPSGTSLPEDIRVALWVMAAMTMTVGNVLALLQSSVKRILAYSSIAHSGYMLVGLVVGPGPQGALSSPAENGLAAMLFYLLCYGVMNMGVFAVLSCLDTLGEDGELVEVDAVEDIKGLCKRQPVLGWTMVVCSLSLLGFPPLIGFFGKLFLFTSAIGAREYVLVVVLGVNSAIGAYYYLRLAAGPVTDEPEASRSRARYNGLTARRLAGVLAAVGVIALVAFVSPLQRASHVATREAPGAGAQVEQAGATEPREAETPDR